VPSDTSDDLETLQLVVPHEDSPAEERTRRRHRHHRPDTLPEASAQQPVQSQGTLVDEETVLGFLRTMKQTLDAAK